MKPSKLREFRGERLREDVGVIRKPLNLWGVIFLYLDERREDGDDDR